MFGFGQINGEPSDYVFLITGCDSGFGLLSSLELSARGYIVYAACLTDNGIQQIQSFNRKNLVACKVDVTKQKDVDLVVEKIQREQGKLFCLINNAGIADGTFLELITMEQYEKTFAVNVFGAVRCAKGCIPLMRNHGPGSRIINISSAASMGYAPGMNSYCPSKSAIRMFGDVMRLELLPFGIKVCNIMPGFFKTNIVHSPKRAIEEYKKVPKEIQQVYGEEFVHAFVNDFQAGTNIMPDPSICVKEIVSCSLAKNPPYEKTVGWDAFLIYHFFYLIPLWIKVFFMNLVFLRFWRKLEWNKNPRKALKSQ